MTDHSDSFADISIDELDHVNGGARRRQPPLHHAGFFESLFGWLNEGYHSIVNNVASHIGGPKLAQTLYGKHTTHADEARAEAAMKKFLVAGHKLPKGVPNLFG